VVKPVYFPLEKQFLQETELYWMFPPFSPLASVQKFVHSWLRNTKKND